MTRHRIGLIGFGKIARERHAPSIAANPRFALTCVADPTGGGSLAGAASFRDHRTLLAGAAVDAVAICTPPAARFAIACDALAAGKHVLLEKPPVATAGELDFLQRLAVAQGCVLFTAWHSQHNPTVERARAVLADREVIALRIDWKEDVEKYHPGQAWIWEPGGFGVFDSGINGLSILSHLFGDALFVRSASLMYAAGRQAPIAANVAFSLDGRSDGFCGEFDWRSGRAEQREIRIQTTGGSLELTGSGDRLVVDGSEVISRPRDEYPAIYARFDALLRDCRSEVDGTPLRLVADAFLVGHRRDL